MCAGIMNESGHISFARRRIASGSRPRMGRPSDVMFPSRPSAVENVVADSSEGMKTRL